MCEPTGLAAVVLCGGLGTRLRSVVADRPKVQAEVLGRPFISYLFDQIAVAGVRRVILASGYRGEQLKHEFGERYHFTKGGPAVLELLYSQETEPLGTGGALRQAAQFAPKSTLLVLNGDSFCEADLGAFLKTHQERKAAA